jgi:predicted ATPase
VPIGPLIGREAELASVRDCLLREDVRLLTLTGAPGVGKTRLALTAAAQLAKAFPGWVAFIDLVPLRDPAHVTRVVAHRLGVRSSPTQSAPDLLRHALRGRRLLLVLDNFDHVVDAAPDVASLVATLSELKVLVTSREPLRVSWEHQLVVPPLQLPDLNRASDPKAVTPANARAVAEICVALDGLPLALELAAAQIKALPPDAIRDRLDHRLTLLQRAARDLPTRHRTLRAAVGWSYSRLDAGQQALFRRLAVFVGGFPLEGVEAVCADLGVDLLDGLTSLVEKSLLQRQEHPGFSRFQMLETVREFALEQLAASGEAGETRRRHAEFYLGLVQRAAPHLTGPEQAQWLARLDCEYSNIRVVLERARASGLDAAILPQFAVGHGEACVARGRRPGGGGVAGLGGERGRGAWARSDRGG